jgi:putative transcription factor
VVVEGAEMTTCGDCASLGTPYQEAKPIPLGTPIPVATYVSTTRLSSVPSKLAGRRAPREIQELDLAENYPQIIQKARRKLELSQEDLAMKVKEHLSIIQKIELGKIEPNVRLIRSLEHVLRVRLLVLTSEPPVPKLAPGTIKEVTLADVAKIRKKEGKSTSKLQA